VVNKQLAGCQIIGPADYPPFVFRPPTLIVVWRTGGSSSWAAAGFPTLHGQADENEKDESNRVYSFVFDHPQQK